MSTPEKLPDFVLDLTVKKLMDDPGLKRMVETYLDALGYELLFPPDQPLRGDEYLGGGVSWQAVTDVTHPSGYVYKEKSYIVRRLSEHKRMVRFFFGEKK